MIKTFYSYIKLLRPKHWIKNILVLFPVFFNIELFSRSILLRGLAGFVIFSLGASLVYIINDIHDAEIDAKHEIKKNRPIASGKISKANATMFAVFLCIVIIAFDIFVKQSIYSWILLCGYIVLNLAYSFKLKNIPLLDVFLLAVFYLLRVLYGAALCDIPVSFWLNMTVVFLSLYMGFGKRRNEIIKIAHIDDTDRETRPVLKFYNQAFLDKNMYMCLGISLIFYSLWCNADETVARIGNKLLPYTIPLVALIAMKYSLDIESGGWADPVDVVTHDKIIMALVFVYAVCLFVIVYVI